MKIFIVSLVALFCMPAAFAAEMIDQENYQEKFIGS
jgi:hypothetical protein